MQFSIPFLVGLSWLAKAAYIPALSTNSTEIESRDVGGYRSVAYYVNWVSSDHIHGYNTKNETGDIKASSKASKEATLIRLSGHLRP